MPQATISVAGLHGRIGKDEKLRLLDVRTPGEFAAAHIAGSHNIPRGDLGGHTAVLSAGAVTDLW